MGQLICSFFSTLDGVVESPQNWHFPFVDDEVQGFIMSDLGRYGAVLFGRRTHDEWLPVWPAQGDSNPFSAFVNNAPKYVLSTTLEESTWPGTEVLRDDVAKRVAEVKAATDGDVFMSGSPTAFRFLLGEGLVDRLDLLVHPLALGAGQTLFGGDDRRQFELVEQRGFHNGSLALSYRPASA